MKINVHKLYSLDGHQDCVYSLEVGKTSNLFYSVAGDGMVVQWDLNNPENGQLLAKMKNSVYAIHYRPNENLVIAGQNFEGIHLVDSDNKKEIGTLQVSRTQIFDIKSFENRIFVGCGDGAFYVIDLASLAFVKKIKLAEKSIRSIEVNRQLGEIAVGLSDNTIRILDLDDYKQKYLINAHKLSVFSVTYNPLNNHLISVGRDAHVKSWNAFNHYELEQSVVAHMFAINSLSISPNRKFFITGSMDKSIKVWDLETFRLLKVIDKSRHAGHTGSVNKVLWTNHDNQILSCSDDKKISVWVLSFN
ncbi:MAG: WD40 repeat domain-containing protein [Cyclobacteriaceae bacterium]|nr:WD40 repeat domain-containing protein [Cyclobacteriaceae bacterium]